MERSLSQEEQDELARSNKKVKDVTHAGFSDGQHSGPSSPSHNSGHWNQSVSFKEKLIGDIPGAYTQAFSLGDLMEDDGDSDEEVEVLRQGFVGVKLTKEFKQKIRGPWVKALIVKVFGRDVGYHFLRDKLLAMWKLAGRLDCVHLGRGFFLVRLSLREDVDNVLKKGPWFVGGHFLSIRPWEPNFRASSANVSSVALWIRLNELPIEYYNVEALQLIGGAIGNVLRIDTFTAFESRGRFARLCVQVDVGKPLATTVMIGKLEQPISYEGLHKLCFGCGRMGHKKANCPYVICQEAPVGEAGLPETATCDETRDSSCVGNVANSPRLVGGPTKDMQDVHAACQEFVGQVQKAAPNDLYGLWVLVERKKSGTRMQRSGGSLGDQRNGSAVRNFGLGEFRSNERFVMDRGGVVDGPERDSKRKLVGLRSLDKAQFENATKRIGKEVVSRAQLGANQNEEFSVYNQSKANSVKGKKMLARLKMSKSESSSTVVEEGTRKGAKNILKKGRAFPEKGRREIGRAHV